MQAVGTLQTNKNTVSKISLSKCWSP